MTIAQFRAIRTGSGLTLQALADWLRVPLRSVQRWEAGDTRIPGPVTLLMEQLAEQHQVKLDAKPPKKRKRKA